MIEERIEEEESELEALLAEKAVDEGELEDIDLIEAEPEEAEAEASPAAAAKSHAGTEAEAAEEAEPAAEEAAAEEGEAAKPAAGAFGNLFAERLKVALAKKRQEAAEKQADEKE